MGLGVVGAGEGLTVGLELGLRGVLKGDLKGWESALVDDAVEKEDEVPRRRRLGRGVEDISSFFFFGGGGVLFGLLGLVMVVGGLAVASQGSVT